MQVVRTLAIENPRRQVWDVPLPAGNPPPENKNLLSLTSQAYFHLLCTSGVV